MNMFGFDTSQLAAGRIGIIVNNLSSESLQNYRMLIQRLPKEDNARYQYILPSTITWLPVQSTGKWEFGVYERLHDADYRPVSVITESVELTDSLAPFLQSTMYMDWTPESLCCKWVADKVPDPKKLADTLQDHIKSNFEYDHELTEQVKYNYCPNLDEIWFSRKSICFGLTAVFNSALRSRGVPAKMLHGYYDKSYHCWSQVWIDGEWKLYDVTFAISVPKLLSWLVIRKKRYDVRYEY